MTKTFTFYADPGHAWLKVSMADIHNAGLSIHHFSQYSYFKGDHFYLEEDADAPLFIYAYQAANPTIAVDFKNSYSKSPSSIRRLTRLDGSMTSFEKRCELTKLYRNKVSAYATSVYEATVNA